MLVSDVIIFTKDNLPVAAANPAAAAESPSVDDAPVAEAAVEDHGGEAADVADAAVEDAAVEEAAVADEESA